MKFIKLLLTFILISAISFTLMFTVLGGFNTTDYNDTAEIEIQLGDTFWSIAKQHMPEMDVREAVHQLKILNPDIDENHISADEKITIPVSSNMETVNMQAFN